MTNTLTCPVCGNTSFRLLHECIDHSVSHETFLVMCCTECHLGITQPQPSEAEIGKYYAFDEYVSHTGKHKGLLGKLYLAARRIALRNKYRIISHYHETGSILDYGCGTGEFLSLMKSNGWKITGVEPSEIAREKSNSLNGNFTYPSLRELPEGTFDCITLWHVLEHVHTLNATIELLTHKLNTSGVIILALPNYLSADSQYYKSYWAGYDVPRHLWHFRKESIVRLLLNHGLILETIKPLKMDSFYVSLLSERYRGTSPSFQLFNAFRSGLLSNLKARSNNNYSSLIYIARAK
jgi:2-polyprenyl-3-methyl-5-hydroxy-6-metoxy-1,4-benzoquinol methylase